MTNEEYENDDLGVTEYVEVHTTSPALDSITWGGQIIIISDKFYRVKTIDLINDNTLQLGVAEL